MRRKKQIGPPHFLFWSFNQPPWWIMGNVWSRPCDPLSFTCQPRCSYNWNWDIGKQVNATFHWAVKWEETHAKPHQPSFLRLHWLGYPALSECRKAHWWTTERRYSAVEKRKRNFNSHSHSFHENCICSSHRNVKTVATISCLVMSKNNNVHFQNLAKRGTSFEAGTKFQKTVQSTWIKSKII